MSVAAVRMLGIGLAILERGLSRPGSTAIETEPIDEWGLALTAAGERALSENNPADGSPGKVNPSAGQCEGRTPSGRSVPPVLLGQGEYRRAWRGSGAPSALERAMASGGLLADGPPCLSCGAPMDYAPETCIENKRGEALRFPAQWVCNCGASRDL